MTLMHLLLAFAALWAAIVAGVVYVGFRYAQDPIRTPAVPATLNAVGRTMPADTPAQINELVRGA